MTEMPDELCKIAHNVLRGFERASEQYENLSGMSFDKAPEYLASTSIAERLLRFSARITLEQNISDVRRQDGKRRSRMPENLPDDGRFDIAFWDSTMRELMVTGVVEVKKALDIRYAHVEKDVQRVCSALKNLPSLEWGIVAYYGYVNEGSRKTASDRLKTKTHNIENDARACAQDAGLYCARVSGSRSLMGNGTWGGADSLVFTRRS